MFKTECAEYQQYVYEDVYVANVYGPPSVVKQNKCSFTSVPFIVGGEQASPKEFPHMVNNGNFRRRFERLINEWRFAFRCFWVFNRLAVTKSHTNAAVH